MSSDKSLDLICLGRALVDLYARQIGSRLEDVGSFAKYTGGSSSNMAVGTARLGLRSAMLTRVGNEHMGRFVRETLQAEGVDVSHVVTDDHRLTALVILGIKDRDTFPLIFYRENCADMAISPEDFDEAFIASSRALAITGTHLSTPSTYETCKIALGYARANDVRTVLDIDYRPVLWGLTGRGEGENRFVADDKVTKMLQGVLADFDLIVGTEEEVHIAGGSTDTLEALRTIRTLTDATLVVKRGALGAVVFAGAIPDSLDEGISVPGVRVEVLNVLGAGDAFMSGFLRGWLRDEGFEQALRYANACGALVVSRHGCAPAMPTSTELDYFLANSENSAQPDRDPDLVHLHRVTTRRGQWRNMSILAFDHRAQFHDMARDVGADPQRIPQLKNLLVDAVIQGSEGVGPEVQHGVLIDDTYGRDALDRVTGAGWWIGRPVEQPKSRPLEFEGGDDLGTRLASWPLEHVVKCLVFFHPDDNAEMRYRQEQKVLSLYRACVASGHELLLEVIAPRGSASDDATLARAMQRFYNLGVRPDWWKLPPMSPQVWNHVEKLVNERDPYCRGVLLLGLGAPFDELRKGFAAAADRPLCKGFAVGRSVFDAPSRAWLSNSIDDPALISAVAGKYRELIGLWTERKRAAA
ncbi:MAG: 5-dehydro-2-deoxygluconokinase [Chromatiales bacterium]|jgi:5-dehydro-2-deoxygluconokinase